MIEFFLAPELGRFALALAATIAIAQAVLPIWGAARGIPRLMFAGGALAIGQFAALLTAAACLVAAAVNDDFSVLNIVENSAHAKPLLYKITGTWGNHEGSIVLWALILAICGAAVAAFGRNLPTALRARVLGVLGFVSAGFLLFSLLASDPFDRVLAPPPDGQGMNPLLQDPGLAFHPPILYTGYVGFAVPFAFAVAALLEGRVDAAWGSWVRPWAVAAWSFLTCGIALGSWWAYYDLGWGGYWFWDPVENASLLPWLTGTALIHSAIVVEKRESLKVWTVLLAIATFALSLSGTFLVRSGILNSVHSFASDPTRGVVLLALLALDIGGALLLFAWRAPALAEGGIFAPLSRESALLLNNVFLCAIAAVVLTGTMYPPLADLLLGEKLSVGKPFFDATVIPMAIPVFAAMSVGPMLPWKRARLAPAITRLWWAALGSAAVIVVASIGVSGTVPILAFGLAAWLVLGAAASVTERIALGKTSLAGSLHRLRTLPGSALGAAIAHAGMGVTLAGLAGMSQSTSRVVLAAPGQHVRVGDADWTLVSLADGAGSNYTARIATIRIARDGRTVAVVHPSRRFFTLQGIATTETAIHTTGLADDYAVLSDEQTGTGKQGAAVLRLQHNPLAPLMWLGALVMAIGGALSVADRRIRVGAPRPRLRARREPAIAE